MALFEIIKLQIPQGDSLFGLMARARKLLEESVCLMSGRLVQNQRKTISDLFGCVGGGGLWFRLAAYH